jgi:hypothetical protein
MGAGIFKYLHMSEQEKRIEELETQFPVISGEAFAEARARALATGVGVVEADEGELYEVFQDGRRRFLKKIQPPIPVRKGAKFSIR